VTDENINGKNLTQQSGNQSSKSYCTAEAQRGRAATETRNFSRKDAKAAKLGKNE
jgi:hypothetical protein